MDAELMAEDLAKTYAQDVLEYYGDALSGPYFLQERSQWIEVLGDQDSYQFTFDESRRLSEYARDIYLRDPLVRRGVRLGATMIWGAGFSTADADEHVEMALKRSLWANPERLFELESDLKIAGNIFIAVELGNGAMPRTQIIPLEQIREFRADDDDTSQLLYVRREWHHQYEQRSAWLPVWGDDGAAEAMPSMIESEMAGQDVAVHPNSFVVHVKAGGFNHWRWGATEFLSSLGWTGEYSDFLSSVVSQMKAQSRFSWMGKTAGGLDRFKAQLEGALNEQAERIYGDYDDDRNTNARTTSSRKDEVLARTLVTNPGADMQPVRSNAYVQPDDGRRIELMVAAGLDISDIYYDSESSNYAISNTVERAALRSWQARQTMWGRIIVQVMQAQCALLGCDGGEFSVEFPDITEHDTGEKITAIDKASKYLSRATVTRLMANELQVKDVEAEVEAAMAEHEAAKASMMQQMQRPDGEEGEDQGDDGAEDDGEQVEAREQGLHELSDDELAELLGELFDEGVEDLLDEFGPQFEVVFRQLGRDVAADPLLDVESWIDNLIDADGNLSVLTEPVDELLKAFDTTAWKNTHLRPIFDDASMKVVEDMWDLMSGVGLSVPRIGRESTIVQFVRQESQRRLDMMNIHKQSHKTIMASLENGWKNRRIRDVNSLKRERALAAGDDSEAPFYREIRDGMLEDMEEQIAAGRMTKAGVEARARTATRTLGKHQQRVMALWGYQEEGLTQIKIVDARLGPERSDPDCIERNGQVIPIGDGLGEVHSEKTHPNCTMILVPVREPQPDTETPSAREPERVFA